MTLKCTASDGGALCPDLTLNPSDGGMSGDGGGPNCSMMGSDCVCTSMASGYTTTLTFNYTDASHFTLDTSTAGPDGGVVSACNYTCAPGM